MIKAVFFDLDGTLLTSDKKINASAREAIQKCRAKGIKMFFATARSPRLDQTLLWTKEDFALFDGAIYANGALILLDGKETYFHIDPEAVRRVLESVSVFDQVHLSLHTPGEGYAFNFPPVDSMEAGWGLSGARILPINDETVVDTVKILVFYDHLTDASKPLPEELVQRIQKECGHLANVYVTDAGKTVQLSSLSAGKKNAIEAVRETLSIERDEVCVFGDDVNDLEMIAFYKNSVAMGNGTEEIKHHAGFVTGKNDEDGIACALERLMNDQLCFTEGRT